MNPIQRLRKERPELFESPEFWRSDLAHVDAAARSTRKGEARVIGRSAGGRRIWAFHYGAFEPQHSTTTISSAMASDRPAAFYDPARRTRPAVAVLGAMHGGETEGIAACLNLVAVLETGRDLHNRPQDALLALLSGMRVVIVPCQNPDGRARAGIRHLSGADIDHIFLVQQGLLKDGSLYKGRRVKELQPVPKGFLRFMGGYYNDDGINLQHDDFFGPTVCPENAAVRDLFRRELPDAFLTFHAHGAHPALTSPDAFLSPSYQRKQSEASFFVISRLIKDGFNVLDPAASTGPPWSFYFQTWLYHMTGALPMLCELPHGIRTCSYPLERILEVGLVVTESWLEFGQRFGFRPKWPDFYGAPPLA